MAHPYLALRPGRNGPGSRKLPAGSNNPTALAVGVSKYVVKMDSLKVNSSFEEITLTTKDALIVIMVVIITAIAFVIWEYTRQKHHSN